MALTKHSKYLDLTKQTLSLATDVCFREKYSYELFKKNPNARWAPDLIFSFDYPKQEKEKKYVGNFNHSFKKQATKRGTRIL